MAIAMTAVAIFNVWMTASSADSGHPAWWSIGDGMMCAWAGFLWATYLNTH